MAGLSDSGLERLEAKRSLDSDTQTINATTKTRQSNSAEKKEKIDNCEIFKKIS
jgi:hypothetical protein